MKYVLLTLMMWTCLAACQTVDHQDDERVDSTVEKQQAEPVGESEKSIEQEFYENGQLKMEGPVVSGQRHGLWKSWYENGIKWSETTFKNGVKTGPTTTFFENGMMRYSGHYENDERVGTWNFYNREGKLEKTVNHDELNRGSSPDSSSVVE